MIPPLGLLNKEEVLARNPYVHKTVPKLTLVEHPVHGEDAPVIAICGDYCWDTGYYDPWHSVSDMADIRRQYDEIVNHFEKET